MLPVESKHVQLDSGRILWVEIYGSRSTDCPALLFANGMASTTNAWSSLIHTFSAEFLASHTIVLHDAANTDSVKIYFDNQGAGALSLGEGLQRRTKHIDARHHFIRECISSGKIDISYTPAADMLADIFTKALGRVKHLAAVKMLGLC